MKNLVLGGSETQNVYGTKGVEACVEVMKREVEPEEKPSFSSCFVDGKFVLITKDKKKEEAEERAFMKILRNGDLRQLRSYLKTHQLSESNEYQLVVALSLMDDDLQAERIISGYIRRCGRISERARRVLAQLNYQDALETWKERQEIDEFAEEEPTMAEKLNDGFAKFVDEDVLNGGFASTYWSELV